MRNLLTRLHPFVCFLDGDMIRDMNVFPDSGETAQLHRWQSIKSSSPTGPVSFVWCVKKQDGEKGRESGRGRIRRNLGGIFRVGAADSSAGYDRGRWSIGMASDDAVAIQVAKRAGEPSVITINCPDQTGLGCDLCRTILEFGLCIARAGDSTILLVLFLLGRIPMSLFLLLWSYLDTLYIVLSPFASGVFIIAFNDILGLLASNR